MHVDFEKDPVETRVQGQCTICCRISKLYIEGACNKELNIEGIAQFWMHWFPFKMGNYP